ncbi:hypothetical protein [Methylobacterium sp. J-067]|uniref:hypothetical protein n=1 Tax=Methylobacterium sp. J-067 TaxID=2836648 RepID=UPI001FBBA76F|nr:hypothetical protein [Methylobacterium sp. J-067]MCJ2025583.1 hypothetical protein [Methylobacterium sp. J-067]
MTSKITLDTSIAAWKAAATQDDRDLAATAIREHIAHETSEGADYDSATDELLARLAAEHGPVPVEDLRGFYIALPATLTPNEVEGIWGIGRSEELALADAYNWNGTGAPVVAEISESKWAVSYDCRRREIFLDEDEARAHAATLGYRAWPCTEALYRRVKSEGYDAHGRNSYGYAKNGSLYVVVERDAA